MSSHHQSRLVELGQNLAALVEVRTSVTLTLGAAGLAFSGAVIGAPFREPRKACGCGGVRHHYRCCYDPPVYGCGG